VKENLKNEEISIQSL